MDKAKHKEQWSTGGSNFTSRQQFDQSVIMSYSFNLQYTRFWLRGMFAYRVLDFFCFSAKRCPVLDGKIFVPI
jgi:hypothetical protein